jgi:peptidoglycan/LPS O-acetylase OafA/YrhL
MFFVLSGFLITTLLLRERDRHGDISLRQFYMRRVLRIFPLYYGILLALTLGLIFVAPNGETAKTFFKELPFYLTGTSNWIQTSTLMAVAWSLATEQQFYTVYPPIEKRVKGLLPKLAIIFGVILVNQLINFGLLDQQLANLGLNRQHLEILQATFTPICFGVLLAHVLYLEKGFRAVAQCLHFTWMPIALGLAIILVCSVPGDISGWPRLSVQVLMTLLLASCVIREDHILSGVLRFAPVRRMGVISYGMYLLHPFMLAIATVVLKKLGSNSSFALFWLCLTLTVIVSEISFRFYEQPFLKLKRWFEPKSLKPSTASSEP